MTAQVVLSLRLPWCGRCRGPTVEVGAEVDKCLHDLSSVSSFSLHPLEFAFIRCSICVHTKTRNLKLCKYRTVRCWLARVGRTLPFL